MVPDVKMKTLFAAIHYDDKDLYNNFSTFYTEVTGLDLKFSDFTKIFGKVQLLKSLFVSAETLSTAQDGIVNGLALAFNVWLEEGDSIFDSQDFSESD